MNLRVWLDEVGYEDLSEVIVESIDGNKSLKDTIKYISKLYDVEIDIDLLLDQIIDLTYNLK